MRKGYVDGGSKFPKENAQNHDFQSDGEERRKEEEKEQRPPLASSNTSRNSWHLGFFYTHYAHIQHTRTYMIHSSALLFTSSQPPPKQYIKRMTLMQNVNQEPPPRPPSILQQSLTTNLPHRPQKLIFSAQDTTRRPPQSRAASPRRSTVRVTTTTPTEHTKDAGPIAIKLAFKTTEHGDGGVNDRGVAVEEDDVPDARRDVDTEATPWGEEKAAVHRVED